MTDVFLEPDWGGYAIEVGSDNITLNGNGRTVAGSPGGASSRAAVLVSGRTGVSVGGIRAEQFQYGVEAVATRDLRIHDSVFWGNGTAVRLEGTSGSIVERVTASGNSMYGVHVAGGAGFTISWNNIMGNDTGIRVSGAASGYLDHNGAGGNNDGILLEGASDIGLYANTVSHNRFSGVRLERASRVTVSTTVIDGTVMGGARTTHGIHLDGSSNISLLSGTISGCFIGIYLRADTRTGSDNLYIADNTVARNEIGIEVFQASHTLVVGNFFDSNVTQDNIGGCMEHLYFSSDDPRRGNHWSEFDEPAEGCDDLDGDGFCDAIFTVFGEYKDRHPLITGGGACPGCPAPPEPPAGVRPALSIGGKDAYWASYDDYGKRQLSVSFTIDNAGPDAYAARHEGATASSGVVPLDAPGLAGDIPAGGSIMISLKFQVPQGVGNFVTQLFISARDAAGASYSYPGPFNGI